MSFPILEALKQAYFPQNTQQNNPIGQGPQNGLMQPGGMYGQGSEVVYPGGIQLTPEEQQALAIQDLLKQSGGGSSGRNAQSMANNYINAGLASYKQTAPDLSMFYQNTWTKPTLSTLGRSR